jgi:hypothetical protein
MCSHIHAREQRGFPVALASLLVANIYMLVFHVAIPWY